MVRHLFTKRKTDAEESAPVFFYARSISCSTLFNSSADCLNFSVSSSLKLISSTCYAPPRPTTDGMLRHSPDRPYSPFRETDTGATVWLSRTIDSAIFAAAIPMP